MSEKKRKIQHIQYVWIEWKTKQKLNENGEMNGN